MKQVMKETEEFLFQRFGERIDINEVPLVFILASPRTGSTLLYQLLVNFFSFFYFSNFINDYFAEFPLVGVVLDLFLHLRNPANYRNLYGKTQGYFEPSEASLIFRNWFGGEHPSQTRGCKVISSKTQHLILTMEGIYKLTGLPILTKNAWNCFRIEELSRLFPCIHFIWLRRDIRLSALSDLEARYKRGGSTIWNSATTANYRDIQKLPYWEQVVEQQYEYNRSIARDLNRFSQRRYVELWYEDICEDTKAQIDKLNQYFTSRLLSVKLKKNRKVPLLNRSSGPPGLEEDYTKILQYVKTHTNRFHNYIYMHQKD